MELQQLLKANLKSNYFTKSCTDINKADFNVFRCIFKSAMTLTVKHCHVSFPAVQLFISDYPCWPQECALIQNVCRVIYTNWGYSCCVEISAGSNKYLSRYLILSCLWAALHRWSIQILMHSSSQLWHPETTCQITGQIKPLSAVLWITIRLIQRCCYQAEPEVMLSVKLLLGNWLV